MSVVESLPSVIIYYFFNCLKCTTIPAKAVKKQSIITAVYSTDCKAIPRNTPRVDTSMLKNKRVSIVAFFMLLSFKWLYKCVCVYSAPSQSHPRTLLFISRINTPSSNSPMISNPFSIRKICVVRIAVSLSG